MATAYAALTSVMNIIDTIQNHPRPPISLHPQLIQSLVETISFLQEFLEAGYTNEVSYDSEPHTLDMLIADAAHAAEDVIESHIMDNILADGEGVSAVDLYESLQKVIDDMEAVKKEAMAVTEKTKGHQHRIPGEDSSSFAASSSFAEPEQFNTMVGFDDILIQVLDTLTSGESRRQIISLTGMGGMGKSTLARNVHQHQLVVEHFDICAWVTVSQQYKIRNILLKLLEGSGENLSQVDEYELGNILHKMLTGRRYLIVLDDIWNMQAWDRLRRFLPDNNNGSRILITTRLSNLAREIDHSHNIEMPILHEDNAWKLFCKHVFREDDCPFELESIGTRIVEGCKGLPLSISVVGGLLGKSKMEKQYWEDIADNLNSTVNNKHCLQILYMSYYNLPVHLKPIFLFLGTVLEHEEFYPIFLYVQILIAEGLVKPVRGKSLEEAAVVCVSELVERNLISIDKTYNTNYWMFKECRMHDLLRDLCLRESQKQKFIYFLGEQIVDTIPQNINSIRRICVAKNTSEAVVLPFLESASLLRSLWWGYSTSLSLPSIKSRLLRFVWPNEMTDPGDAQKFNLRVIEICDPNRLTSITLLRFWNLHMILGTEVSSSDVIMVQYDIWNMSQLRFIVGISLCLPDPPGREDCGIVLENLHMINKICNFKCSEEVVKRISRIKLLLLHYTHVEGSYCLHNLGRLQQLEFLTIEVDTLTHIIKNQNLNITFPRSLIGLYLSGTRLHWDDVTANIGPLPHLQILRLHGDSCIGAKWETIEGQFCHLELLGIVECCDLENWTTESTHFPRLKALSLEDLDKLKEIPSSVGDIPTLELIELERCCDSANYSARSIKEEQEELGNEDLYVMIDGEFI